MFINSSETISIIINTHGRINKYISNKQLKSECDV